MTFVTTGVAYSKLFYRLLVMHAALHNWHGTRNIDLIRRHRVTVEQLKCLFCAVTTGVEANLNLQTFSNVMPLYAIAIASTT